MCVKLIVVDFAEITEMLPGILNQLGAESLTHLKKLANNVTSQFNPQAQLGQLPENDDDDIPGKINSQLLLYRTGGWGGQSPVYKKSGISEYQTVYKTYCELFLRGGLKFILGPVCANSGITESPV